MSRVTTRPVIVLSKRPGAKAWSDFFALLHSIDVPADFMAERPLNVAPKARGVFDDDDSADATATFSHAAHARYGHVQLPHPGKFATQAVISMKNRTNTPTFHAKFRHASTPSSS
jgi:hypothetical protein